MLQLHRGLSISLRAAYRVPTVAFPVGVCSTSAAPAPKKIMGVRQEAAIFQRSVNGIRPSASWTSVRGMSTEGKSEAGEAGENMADVTTETADAGAQETGRQKGRRPQRGKREQRGEYPTVDGTATDYNPVAMHPLLSTETKTLMYRLHKEDPKQNSEAALAARFGISDLRVKAILLLQSRYQEMLKAGTLDPRGLEAEQYVERTCGTVTSGFSSPFYQIDQEGFRGMKADAQERNIKARPRPLFDVIDAHKTIARLEAKYSGAGTVNQTLVEENRLRTAAAAEVPVTPMVQKHGVEATMSTRWNFVFADISKGVTGQSRLVLVRDRDGTCRAANFEERYRVEQYVAPPKLPPS